MPVLVWGAIRARARAMDPIAAAAHLDRRLGLDGLLLCAGEQQQLDGRFRARLEHKLAGLPAVMPQLRWGRLLPLPLLALGLAALTALLPPPPEPVRPRQLPAFAAEVGRLDAELRDLFDRGNVPEEIEQELERKLDDLRSQVEAGQMPEWRDFDELDQRITREQLMQLANEGNGRAAGADDGGAAAGRSLESLAALAGQLARLGLLDELSPQLKAALQSVRQADGSFALDQLSFDAAEVQALAEAFGDALGDFDLAQLGLDGEALEDLRQLIEGLGAGVPGGGQIGGRGGLDRGPGHAALQLTESAAGGADAALPLPPGRGLPEHWVPLGSERIEPVVAPVRSQAAGRAGSTGSGGATWQLEYAPRHRAVLKRFFGKEGR